MDKIDINLHKILRSRIKGWKGRMIPGFMITGLEKLVHQDELNAALDAITAALVAGDKVQVSGFGIFEVKEREARVGRNPRTGEAMEIAASKVPGFKASKTLKDAVSK